MLIYVGYIDNFFIIGFLPLIFQYTPIPELLGLEKDYTFAELGLGIFGDSEVECSFFTIYFFPLDWRYDFSVSENERFKVFTSASIAPQLMSTDDTGGIDYSWIWATSLGISYKLKSNKLLQFHIRPYLISGNQLLKGRSLPGGMEFKISYGWIKNRNW